MYTLHSMIYFLQFNDKLFQFNLFHFNIILSLECCSQWLANNKTVGAPARNQEYLFYHFIIFIISSRIFFTVTFITSTFIRTKLSLFPPFLAGANSNSRLQLMGITKQQILSFHHEYFLL